MQNRSNKETEYEIIDTGIFDQNEYFDIFIEYAKIHHDDILIRVTVTNRNTEKAPLVILPTLWYTEIIGVGVIILINLILQRAIVVK